MSKNFKIARKPGQGTGQTLQSDISTAVPASPSRSSRTKSKPVATVPDATGGPTTRKTIEVPEQYFYKVKMRALERKMLEKELWAEILTDYFKTHPTA